MVGGLTERDRAAVHEAAHVLVGWLVGIHAKAVTVAHEIGEGRGVTIVDIPSNVQAYGVVAMFAAGAVAEQGHFQSDDPNDWAEDTNAANRYLTNVCGVTDPGVQAECFEAGKALAASLLSGRGAEWAAVAKALARAGTMDAGQLRKLGAEILVLGRLTKS